MAEQRPLLTPCLSGAELRRWYWTKAELMELARSLRVRTSGSKEQLADRLADRLDGHAEPKEPTRRPGTPQLTEPLSAQRP